MSVQHTRKSSDPARTGLTLVDDGRMWADDSYRRQLVESGLTDFEAVMSTRDGHCMRALLDRENWRLQLSDVRFDGQEASKKMCYLDKATAARSNGVYLKKHHVRTWRSRITALLGLGPGETPGRVEARNVGSLSADGIEVMRLVAYGEKLHLNGLIESFVLTEELQGYTQLDTFLVDRFKPCDPQKTTKRDPDLNHLICKVADVAKRFHEAGYNHRDLYCCHFFIKEPRPGQFEIRMIDLQRVQNRRCFRRRWLVKDLAQLAWSARSDRIKCTHRMMFIHRYLGVSKLRPRDKRLIREVLCKQGVMHRKLGVNQ